MNINNSKHNLIEHMLMLLNSATENNINLDQIAENITQSKFSLKNRNTEKTIYEIMNFMDEMPGGFLIYRADGDEQIIYANKALLRIFQCDTMMEFQKLTGNSFSGIVHPDDLRSVEISVAEQIANSQYDLDYVEYRIIRKDGQIRWVEDYGHFIRSKTVGNIFYVFMFDITDKRALLMDEKAKMDEKEAKLRNLIKEYDHDRKIINQELLHRLEVIEGLSVNYASILYIDLDTDKVLPYRLSIRTEQQFSSEFKEHKYSLYASDYIDKWVLPEDRELVAKVTSPQYIRDTLSNSKAFYINYRIIGKDKPQYFQLRIVNVSNNSPVSQIVMGYRNVDEEILHEKEQQQALEKALHNATLANNAKNTFLSNMSHDMRTPLNAIFGYTTLAKQHLQDTEAASVYIDKIEASSHQLLELIEKVLQISWMESKDIQLSETECNLCDIFQDLQKSLSPHAANKNIALNVCSSGLTHCDVYGDKEKLKQLLQYLCNNAIKYTENGGKVTIDAKELKQLPNDCAVYQFIIQDTGIGISKDFLQNIFKPFEREQNTTLSGVYGTGLGLTIAKHIIDMMGGTITAQSTVGVGSTFTVTVQLRVQTSPLQSSVNTDQLLAKLLNKRILLVDDNEINLEIETEILQDLGLLIETAENGKIAVDMVKDSEPGYYTLVLMDIQMPVMDGWQATQEIRRLDDPVLCRIPVIALSANAFDQDKRLSTESGMDAHLTKPMDIPLLLETIARILHSHMQSDQALNEL